MSKDMKAHAGSVMQIDVVALRGSLVEAVMVGEGTYRDYARGLNTYFAQAHPGQNLPWYACDRTDKSDYAKAGRAEMSALAEALKARGYSNPAVITGRVKKYAAEEHDKLAREMAGDLGDAAAEAEGGNGAGSKARTPTMRFAEELIKLYKFGMKQDDLPAKCEEALESIKEALRAMGIDAETIKV